MFALGYRDGREWKAKDERGRAKVNRRESGREREGEINVQRTMTSTAYPPHLWSHQDTETQRGGGLAGGGGGGGGEGGEETHVRVSIDTRRGGAQRN